jgi:hypothetical protein
LWPPVARRTAEGLSKMEIIRCLKRYVASEVYPHLRPPVEGRLLARYPHDLSHGPTADSARVLAEWEVWAAC